MSPASTDFSIDFVVLDFWVLSELWLWLVRKWFIAASFWKSLTVNLKQDFTTATLKKCLGSRVYRQKAHSVEFYCDVINIFIANSVLAFVCALRFALDVKAMVRAKSPIWPQNEFPGSKMNLQAWLAYKNILNFREKWPELCFLGKWVFFCCCFKGLCFFPSNNIITLNFYHSARHCNM